MHIWKPYVCWGKEKEREKTEKKNWKRVTLKDRFQGMSLCEKNIL